MRNMGPRWLQISKWMTNGREGKALRHRRMQTNKRVRKDGIGAPCGTHDSSNWSRQQSPTDVQSGGWKLHQEQGIYISYCSSWLLVTTTCLLTVRRRDLAETIITKWKTLIHQEPDRNWKHDKEHVMLKWWVYGLDKQSVLMLTS